MRPCYVIQIKTPTGVLLNGLWFGPKKPKQAIVWVHGLGSSMFSKLSIVDRLVDKKTAVLMFNNRGHDKIASIKNARGKYFKAGSVHEVFTDCRDDIQGAVNFVRKNGIQDIYLAGHSTGCQKSIHYVSKHPKGICGAIILGPISDYSAELKSQGKKAIQKAAVFARAHVKSGKKNVMLPENIWGWPWIADAQRFLSLYSGKGAEEVFTYWNSKEIPRTLRSVRIPVLVLLAEKDEFADTSTTGIAAWFQKHVQKGKVVVVPRVGHSFKGAENIVARTIRDFIKRGGANVA